MIVTRAPGYVLNAEPEMLDLERFERLAAEGRSLLEQGDCGAASDRLRQALGLWRGAALAGAHETPSTRAETLRLGSSSSRRSKIAWTPTSRWAATLISFPSSRLSFGGSLSVSDSRPADARALPLGSAGRGARVVSRTRARFVDELGIEPTPRLRELEQAILHQDPELDAGLPRLRARARLRRNRRRVAATLAAVVLAAVTGIAILLALRGNGSPSPGVGPNMLAVVDLATRRVEASVRVGTSPNAIAYGHGSLWVANTDDETLSRIDPRTREVVATIGVGPAVDLAIGPDAVWTANGIDGTVGRVDPESGVRIATIDLRGDDPVVPNTVNAVAVGGGAVWAAVARSVVRIDPATNRVARVVKLGTTPFFVRYGHGSVWAATSAERLLRIEPRTGDVTGATRTGFPEGLEVLDEGVAVLADDAWVVDPTSGLLLVTVNIPGYASALADLPGPVSGGDLGRGGRMARQRRSQPARTDRAERRDSVDGGRGRPALGRGQGAVPVSLARGQCLRDRWDTSSCDVGQDTLRLPSDVGGTLGLNRPSESAPSATPRVVSSAGRRRPSTSNSIVR